MTVVVGISAFYHDSAAAIVRDGVIVAAAQEERFTRKKHDAGFPAHALRYCVAEAGIAWSDIDFVTFYEKPFLKFERLLETYLAFAPKGFTSFRMAIPLWLKEKLFQKSLLIELLRAEAPDVDWEAKLRFTEHHESHAASAFYPSPFDDGRDPHHGRRRRVGHHQHGHGAGQRALARPRRSSFRIRSGCSIRRSPTTPASRSIPASTR